MSKRKAPSDDTSVEVVSTDGSKKQRVDDGSGLAAKAKLLKKNLAAKLAKLKNKKKETVVDGQNNAPAGLASKAKLLKESLKSKLAKLKGKDTKEDGGEVVEKGKNVDKGAKQNPYLAHRNIAATNRKVGKPNNYNSYVNDRGRKRANFIPSHLTRRKQFLFVAEKKAQEKLERRRFVPNVDDDPQGDNIDKPGTGGDTMPRVTTSDLPPMQIRSENFLNDLSSSTLIPEWWDCDFLPKHSKQLAQQFWLEWRDKVGSEGTDFKVSEVKQIMSTFVATEPPKRSVKLASEFKYIENPKSYAVVGEEKDPGPQNLILTNKERRRIRKRAREERRKDEQIKIQMGLIPPPEPKVKLSNMARVLGEQAVADPSKIEMYVKEQMEQRLNKHKMSNLARKLTPGERREKKTEKLKEDTSVAVHTALYCVTGTMLKQSPQTRFKVNMNSKQYNLTGVCLMGVEDKASLIIIEGGEKGLKKLNRLLLHRIKWEQEGSSTSGATKKACTLLWEGVIPKRLYKDFRLEECTALPRVRQRMRDRGAEHYLDMAINHISFSS